MTALAAAQSAPAPCIGCQVLSLAPDQAALLAPPLAGVRLAVRVAPGADDGWKTAVAGLRGRGALVSVHLTGVPGADEPVLQEPVEALIFEPAGSNVDELAFDLKRALTRARGANAAARLVIAVPAALADALRARGLEPYLDRIIAPALPIAAPADLLSPLAEGDMVLRLLPTGADAARAIVAAAAAAADWFPPGLVPVPERPMRCGDRAIPTLLNPQTLDLVAMTRECPPQAAVTSDVPGAAAERIAVGDVTALRVRAGASDRFAEGVTVGAARALTAEEVVARHQAAAARQAAAIRTDVASGTLTLTFEAPGFVAPVTVTSKTTIFRDAAAVDVQQSDIRVNGVGFTPKDGVPRLPILEPERVTAVPLTITLTSVYRYALAGRETVDGRACYVIAFSPAQAGVSLFAGRAWIDERTFAMVRVAAAQTGLRGPIVASEQTDTFAPDAAGRWLLARSDIRQTYEGASVRTPIHRLLEIARHEIDAPDYAARRAAAYASRDVILRDTPEGFRYLKREAVKAPPEGATAPTVARVQRVVVPPVTRIRTFAAGVIVDPNISVPLPFAGLSYVDFDLLHTGTQFSGFFGGTYGQLAFSAPSVAGSRWQIAGRAFGIATSYNDRAFENGREIYTRDIRQQPAQAAVWALRPIGPRAAIRLEYDWDYNRFDRAPETDPAFVVPANQRAHGLRAGIDLQRAGWQVSLWGSHTMRAGWRRWGVPGSAEDEAPKPSFDRAGASVARTAALSPRLTGRAEASFTTGRNMDRFSRIAFGAFDNRLHGYPSALIRYDRGGVLRSSLSWAAAKAIRLDGFADTAAVHDPAFGRGLRGYTGFGAAFECPAPFGTLAAIEWGYGVQGVNSNGRTGTHVVRITGYKVF